LYCHCCEQILLSQGGEGVAARLPTQGQGVLLGSLGSKRDMAYDFRKRRHDLIQIQKFSI
jgi:hypothetical protein